MTTHSTLYIALRKAKLGLLADIIAFRADPTDPGAIVDAMKHFDAAYTLIATVEFYRHLNKDELYEVIDILDFMDKAQAWFIDECKKLP